MKLRSREGLLGSVKGDKRGEQLFYRIRLHLQVTGVFHNLLIEEIAQHIADLSDRLQRLRRDYYRLFTVGITADFKV